MADPEALPKAERSFVIHLLDQLPSMADAIDIANRLNALLRRKTSEGLSQILDPTAETPLEGFAKSLLRDIGAIKASLDLPWTTSPVEGQIKRLKMLKRTMYGRAGFELLRARVPHAALQNDSTQVAEEPMDGPNLAWSPTHLGLSHAAASMIW